MISSIEFKKLTLITDIFCAYLVNLNYRLNLKLSILRPNHVDYPLENIRYKSKTALQIKRCRLNGPITLSFNDGTDPLKIAEILFDSKNLNYHTVCTDNFWNLCSNYETCVSVDFGDFLRSYFKKITSKSDLQVFKSVQCDKYGTRYELNEDYDEILNNRNHNGEKILNHLGFMFGLAFVTETYLDIKFDEFFLINYLEYKTIQVYEEYYKYIQAGLKIIMNSVPADNYVVFYYRYSEFDYIFSKFSKDLNIYDWKDYSIYDSSSRMFWKALHEMESTMQLEIYTKVTGLRRVPLGGFSKIPKTKIISHPDMDGIEMFQKLHEINVKSNASLDEMLNDLEKTSDSYY